MISLKTIWVLVSHHSTLNRYPLSLKNSINRKKEKHSLHLSISLLRKILFKEETSNNKHYQSGKILKVSYRWKLISLIMMIAMVNNILYHTLKKLSRALKSA
jgi:hypothetical protein